MHNHPTPKFSIITVTYNAEAVLEDTIQSVISQTYHHVEYIIIDGASKDKTLSIAFLMELPLRKCLLFFQLLQLLKIW